jgi:hypothetical protein
LRRKADGTVNFAGDLDKASVPDDVVSAAAAIARRDNDRLPRQELSTPTEIAVCPANRFTL